MKLIAQDVFLIYQKLFEAYGPQGWWPLLGYGGTNPSKSGAVKGYHPGDYSFPHNDKEHFEICVGAILTQNTNWPSVEKALMNLDRVNLLSLDSFVLVSEERLSELIRPARYFRQKARYLKAFSFFLLGLQGRVPTRIELLAQLGIGPETADSILLYAYRQPEFVIDAYTRRIFSHYGFFAETVLYETAKKVFIGQLELVLSDEIKRVQVYQEYHALIVEHAKRYYQRRSLAADPLLIGL
jgi:endonuclease-3 related protein